MDLSELSSVTSKAEMLAWLAARIVTPVLPPISGSDFSAILQKLLSLTGDDDSLLFDRKTADYTLGLTDNALSFDLDAPGTVTVPANSIVSIPVGKRIQILQIGTGLVTLQAGAGVTINSINGPQNQSLYAKFSSASLIKTDTDTWLLQGVLTASPVTVIAPPKLVKINLTNDGGDATSPGWYNMYFSDIGQPLALESPDGYAVGWTITAGIGTADTGHYEHIPSATFGNTDFPDDVLQWLWYADHGTNINFTIIGLDTSKTYTVKTCTADNGTGDGTTNINVGGTSQTATPDGVAVELTFNGVVSDESGHLSILVDNTAGAPYPLINAIIITEN